MTGWNFGVWIKKMSNDKSLEHFAVDISQEALQCLSTDVLKAQSRRVSHFRLCCFFLNASNASLAQTTFHRNNLCYTRKPSDICGKWTWGQSSWARSVWTLFMTFFWCPSSDTPNVSKSFTVKRITWSILITPADRKLLQYRSILIAFNHSSTEA